ncbi:hypothetical protein NAEGRDRAFT_78630 [Naegleria gruberi]|uniref:Transmembrane protein n=1 Tax=Naegleria gruberi TaxID=5762 RepID=D2V538_NAEGR|nr:uncharacterized protein NAEGRDRAFT_78630 [Naegleria gruberi]EFC48041.1 hypothetical protein NAEGRDRAFT_78630 [Naegleria gruberi]|eukprot:XP_002680785.1 hypothetical protein NAEGRDRAFT_78630 [Naegleria gruberi strain NEG-M]
MKHQRDQVKNSQKSTSLSMYIILSLMVAVMGYLVNQQMIINQYNKNLESKLAKLENPQLEFKMVSKVGLGDIFVECPASFTLLSCGINHSDNGHNTGHRPFSTTGCVCSQNADETNLHLKYTCFAYCMKNPSLYQSKTKPYPLSIE